jgi:DNA-binding beta-propeller fold protein YncE
MLFIFIFAHEKIDATLPNRLPVVKCNDGQFGCLPDRFTNFVEKTQLGKLLTYSTIDQENIKKKRVITSACATKETQAIVAYCSEPDRVIKSLPNSLEDLCKLWIATDYFQPAQQLNNNNNNNIEKVFAPLQKEIAFKLAQHLVDNVTPTNIDAVKTSELPPKLSKRVNKYVASLYAIQSVKNDFLQTPAHEVSLGGLKLRLNPEGDKVVITNNIADNGMVIDKKGSILGAFVASEKNAVTAFGRNGIFAYPIKNNANNQDCVVVNNLNTQAQLATIDFGQGSVCRMKFSPDSTKLAIVAGKLLTLWDANNPNPNTSSTTQFGLKSDLQKYEISFGQEYLGISSAAGDSFIIDTATKQLVKDFRNEKEKIVSLSFEPNSNKYVTLDQKGYVYQRQLDSAQEEKLFAQEIGNGALSFLRNGYVISQLEKKIDTHQTHSILNFYNIQKKRISKTIETANQCEGVTLFGESKNMLIKDGKIIKIYHQLRDEPIELFPQFSGNFDFSGDQNTMIVQHQDGNLHWATLRNDQIPSWKPYRSLQVILDEEQKPGSGSKALSRLLETPSEQNTIDLSGQPGKEEK